MGTEPAGFGGSDPSLQRKPRTLPLKKSTRNQGETQLAKVLSPACAAAGQFSVPSHVDLPQAAPNTPDFGAQTSRPETVFVFLMLFQKGSVSLHCEISKKDDVVFGVFLNPFRFSEMPILT